jgi:hypothetical protein
MDQYLGPQLGAAAIGGPGGGLGPAGMIRPEQVIDKLTERITDRLRNELKVELQVRRRAVSMCRSVSGLDELMTLLLHGPCVRREWHSSTGNSCTAFLIIGQLYNTSNDHRSSIACALQKESATMQEAASQVRLGAVRLIYLVSYTAWLE